MKPSRQLSKSFLAAWVVIQFLAALPTAAVTTPFTFTVTGSGSSVKVSDTVTTYTDEGTGIVTPLGNVTLSNTGTLTVTGATTATVTGNLTITLADGEII